jgi:hypothetical protein
MKSKLLPIIAIALILEIGLIHLINAQGEYEEAAYMGYLFAVNFFGALIAAGGIYRQHQWGWMLGLLIVCGSIAGYAWSRTLGMPGMDVEEWLTPFGIVALLLEAAFILLVLMRPWRLGSSEPLLPAGSKRRLAIPVTGLVFIIAVSALASRWNAEFTQAYGLHVGSLSQVSATPATSFTDLENEYGIQVSLVATSMMDSIVDVRIKIIDPEKAHSLLQDQAALLLDHQALILAPHMHSHTVTRLKAGKVFVIFFPTEQEIHIGAEVSLVFGSVRTEPVLVQ